jgi:hypothetical protein
MMLRGRDAFETGAARGIGRLALAPSDGSAKPARAGLVGGAGGRSDARAGRAELEAAAKEARRRGTSRRRCSVSRARPV